MREPIVIGTFLELPQPEVETEEPVPVPGLQMVADGVPAVGLGPFDQIGPDRIQVDIGQAIDQRLPVFHDHAFKPIPPKEAAALMLFIIVAREALLQFLQKLRKTGPFLPVKFISVFRKHGISSINRLVPGNDFRIAVIGIGPHADQEVKVVAHHAEANNFSKINFR